MNGGKRVVNRSARVASSSGPGRRLVGSLVAVAFAFSACAGAAPTPAPATASTTPAAATPAPTVTQAATVTPAATAAATATPAVSATPVASASPADTSTPAVSPTEAATPAPTTGPTGSTLVVGVETLGAQAWEPWLSQDSQEVTNLIGDTLLLQDPATRQFLPGLAESWSLSDDLTTWSFKLKPNIPFQGGYGTVSAEDVRFSWEQFLNPDSTQSASGVLSQAVDGDMKNFEVVGPLEFKLHTTHPVSYLPLELSNATSGLKIQSKTYFETKPAEALIHPLGTGPYEFVSSNPGVEVRLKAVENHWRHTPAFKELIFKIVPDEAARLAQLQTGQLDLAPLPATLLAEAAAGGVKVVSVKDVKAASLIMGGQYYATPELNDCASPWVQCDAPAKGLAIRQAMSLAIDRASICAKIMGGECTLTHAPSYEFPNTAQLVDPSWTLPAYDPDAAKAKLAEGGYPDGFTFKMWIYEDLPGSADAGEAIAGMFEAIGLTVQREVVEYGPVVRPRLMKGDTKGYVWLTWQSDYQETLLALKIGQTVGATFKIYNDAALDDALAKLLAEPDQSKRYAIVRAMLKSLIDSVTVIPMFVVNKPYGISNRITNWTPVPGLEEITNLEYVTPAN
jgi:peptide/nickel transport system substrate-binding protein